MLNENMNSFLGLMHHLGGEGGARDQAAWDELFDEFVACGENWLQSKYVSTHTALHERATTGTWALLSKKEPYLKSFSALAGDHQSIWVMGTRPGQLGKYITTDLSKP